MFSFDHLRFSLTRHYKHQKIPIAYQKPALILFMTISNATPYEPINQYLKHISLGLQILCMCILTDYKNTINGTGIYWEMYCEDRNSERLLLLHQVTTDWRRCTEIQNSHIQVTVNFRVASHNVSTRFQD